MSVEVLSAGAAGAAGSPGAVGEAGQSVRGLRDSLYSMFLSDSEPATTSALAPPMLPTPLLPSTSPHPSMPSPAATGCSMGGVTKTVMVYAGLDAQFLRLKTAMERTKPLADLARERGNVVHYVFLGGALPPPGSVDYSVVEWLIAVKNGSKAYGIDAANVHFIVGPREMQALSTVASGQTTATVAQYLKVSKLIECLGPENMDEQGTGGLWLKCTSTQGGSIVGKLPGIGVVGASGPRAEWIEAPTKLTTVAWKNELNTRWQAAAANPKALRDEQPNKWQFWMTLGVQSALDGELLPAQGLDTESCKSMAVFSRQTAAFGTVRRTLRIDKKSMMLLPEQCWMDVGVEGDSLYWAVQTWCQGTMKAMNSHKLPMLDRTPNMSELQYDVSCTLGSLVQHSERDDALTPPQRPWANFGALRGQLGPCVCGGRDGQEVLRAIHWSGPEMPDVMMLLPEAYMRWVLSDYFQDMVGVQHLGARAVSGFLVLPDEQLVPMRLPHLSEVEQAYASQTMGARMWRVPDRIKPTAGPLADMTAAPPAWRQILSYKVAGKDAAPDLVPGQRLDSTSHGHIFYTHTTTADPLSGLYVRWVFAPSDAPGARDMPTLDLANGAYESAA